MGKTEECNFGRNYLLEEILSELNSRKPDWDEVIERYRSSRRYKVMRRINKDSLNHLMNQLSELTVHVALDHIVRDFGVEDRVDLDPIWAPSSTESYTFLKRKGKLIVENANTKNDHTDIDCIALVDDLPVIFEVKLARYSAAGIKRGGLRGALKRSNITRMQDPVLEYFDCKKTGFVFLAPPEEIRVRSRALQREFVKANGFLLKWYTRKDSYMEELIGISKKANMGKRPINLP